MLSQTSVTGAHHVHCAQTQATHPATLCLCRLPAQQSNHGCPAAHCRELHTPTRPTRPSSIAPRLCDHGRACRPLLGFATSGLFRAARQPPCPCRWRGCSSSGTSRRSERCGRTSPPAMAERPASFLSNAPWGWTGIAVHSTPAAHAQEDVRANDTDAGPATAAAGPHWRAAERARSRGTAARPPSAQRARRHADPVSAAPSRPAHPPTTRERPRGPAPRWLRTAVAAAATPEAARPARVRPALLRSPVLCVSQARGAHHCRRPDALLRACGAGRVRARGRRCRGAPSRSAGRHRRSCRPRGSLPCTCARACRTAWSSDAASRTWRLSQLAGSISGANCSWGCRSSSFSTHGSFDKRGAR